jgi:hypothetical protein
MVGLVPTTHVFATSGCRHKRLPSPSRGRVWGWGAFRLVSAHPVVRPPPLPLPTRGRGSHFAWCRCGASSTRSRSTCLIEKTLSRLALRAAALPRRARLSALRRRADRQPPAGGTASRWRCCPATTGRTSGWPATARCRQSSRRTCSAISRPVAAPRTCGGCSGASRAISKRERDPHPARLRGATFSREGRRRS